MGNIGGKIQIRSDPHEVDAMMDEFDFPNYTPPPTKENLELVKLLAEVQNNPMQWEHTTRFPTTPELYWYQKDALKAVIQNKQQLLVFPTGKGKTMVALAAIQHYHSHTVIIAPTIYLCHQWASEIEKCGGSCTIVSSETGNIFANTTIITYASALQHITEIAQYDLVVFDEAHHVVAPEYYRIAKGIIAVNKFKKLIGLTASPNTQKQRYPVPGYQDPLLWHKHRPILQRSGK